MAQLLSIKFLVSGSFAGSLIGTAGASVKELMEVSDCKVSVSGTQDYYPGTSDRVVVLSGEVEAVNTAADLIWELIYLQSQNPGKIRSVVWSPKAYKELLSSDNERQLTGKLSIPSDAGGLVLGRGGANMRFMCETSGAKLQMTTKEESLFTQERIMTISGTVSECRKLTSLVLAKLSEEEESTFYANKGTKYVPLALGRPSRSDSRDPLSAEGSPRGRASPMMARSPVSVPATSQMTLTVPESLIGNIIGKQGATLREMAQLSGAKIEVSVRPEFASGTDDRVVTITGTPHAAQTAHAFCIEKLKQGKSSPRVRSPRTKKD